MVNFPFAFKEEMYLEDTVSPVLHKILGSLVFRDWWNFQKQQCLGIDRFASVLEWFGE